MASEAPHPFDVRNAGKPWDSREESRLANLVVANQPMRLIVRELGRPEAEIRAKTDELGIEFDNSAYNPRGLHEKKDS
jgi:hypothetical protein